MILISKYNILKPILTTILLFCFLLFVADQLFRDIRTPPPFIIIYASLTSHDPLDAHGINEKPFNVI